MAYISQPKSDTLKAQASSVGAINPQSSHPTVTADEAQRVDAANKLKAKHGVADKHTDSKKGNKWYNKLIDTVGKAAAGS